MNNDNSTTSNNPTNQQSNTTEQVANKEPNYQLELLSFKCYQQYDYYHIEGQVKNISDKSLKNVTALGTAYTEDDQFITSEDAIINYNPILAGQTSPFKIIMTYNPAMAKCQVDFKELIGGSIPTKID